MADSSLANWDGSLGTTSPTSSSAFSLSIQTSPENLNPIIPIDKRVDGAAQGPHIQPFLHRNPGAKTTVRIDTTPLAAQTIANPPGSAVSPSATSKSMSGPPPRVNLPTFHASSPQAQVQTASRIVRTDVAPPPNSTPTPLHFGTPRGILTTPALESTPAPLWLRHADVGASPLSPLSPRVLGGVPRAESSGSLHTSGASPHGRIVPLSRLLSAPIDPGQPGTNTNPKPTNSTTTTAQSTPGTPVRSPSASGSPTSGLPSPLTSASGVALGSVLHQKQSGLGAAGSWFTNNSSGASPYYPQPMARDGAGPSVLDASPPVFDGSRNITPHMLEKWLPPGTSGQGKKQKQTATKTNKMAAGRSGEGQGIMQMGAGQKLDVPLVTRWPAGPSTGYPESHLFANVSVSDTSNGLIAMSNGPVANASPYYRGEWTSGSPMAGLPLGLGGMGASASADAGGVRPGVGASTSANWGRSGDGSESASRGAVRSDAWWSGDGERTSSATDHNAHAGHGHGRAGGMRNGDGSPMVAVGSSNSKNSNLNLGGRGRSVDMDSTEYEYSNDVDLDLDNLNSNINLQSHPHPGGATLQPAPPPPATMMMPAVFPSRQRSMGVLIPATNAPRSALPLEVIPARDLFMPSPTPTPSPSPEPQTARELFSASPERLFTPETEGEPEHRAWVAVRKPTVGGSEKSKGQEDGARKRKRIVMDFVAVPEGRWKRARREERVVSASVGASGSGRGRGRTSTSAASWRGESRSVKREDDGEEEDRRRSRRSKTADRAVHKSLGDALNQAWAQNERAGTMPIGVQREKTKKKQSREQEREVGRGKRVGRQKRDEDDLKTEAVLVANKADWVEELNGEGERITRLMFDVDVDGADRAASENLELAACAEWELAWAKGLVAPEKMGLGKERPQTCLVVPRPLDPGFVSDYYAGGEVRGRYEVSEETSGKLAQNGKATSGDKGKPKRNPTNAAKPKPRPLPRRAPSLVVPTSAGPRAAPPRRDDQVSTPSTSSRGLLLPAPSTAAKPRRRTPSPEPVPETPQTEDEDPMDVGEEVIVPMSMKALGKQKAPNRSPTPPLCDHEMNAFYQIPDKPPPQQQFYVSPQSLHYPLSAPVPPAPNHATSVQPMSTYFSALDHEPYGNGTIDPALLGGGIMEPLVDYASSVASSSPSPPASPPPASAPAPAAFATARTPTRRPVHRPGMVRTDLLDLDDDDDDGYSSSSSSLSSASSEFKVNFKSRTPPPEPQQSVAVLKPAVSAPTPKKNPQTKVNPETTAISNDPFFRYSGPPWPKGGRELFCHQCRSKKDVLIMACPCARNFCVSCVMRRYDPGVVEFRLDPPLGLCPMCRDICTCDKCTTNRGEVYVSRRLSRSGPRFARPLMPRRGAAPRVQTPRVPAAPRLPRRAPLPSLNQVIVPTTYHGIIYDLNGNPISSAYLGADGNTAVVVTRPIPRRRVFVGAVQDSWNLGPNPPVYVDAVPVKKPPLKNGRQRKIRYYIGDKDLLFQSVRPLPASRTSVAAIPDAPVEPTIPDDSVVAISDSSVETDIHNPVAAEIPNDSVVAIRDSSIDDDPVAAEIPDDPVAVPDEPMAQIPNPVAAIPHVAAVISRASSPLSSLGDIEGED